MRAYEVTYTLQGGVWLGRCDEVRANTFARTISGVRRDMAEAIAVSINQALDSFTMTETIDWGDGDLNAVFGELREARARYEDAQHRLEDLNREAVAKWSTLPSSTGLRDLAEGLGVSLGRAQQLTSH